MLNPPFWLRVQYPDGKAVWDSLVVGFGPIRALAANLAEDKREAFKRDFIEYHDGFKTENGLNWPREYLLSIGTRK